MPDPALEVVRGMILEDRHGEDQTPKRQTGDRYERKCRSPTQGLERDITKLEDDQRTPFLEKLQNAHPPPAPAPADAHRHPLACGACPAVLCGRRRLSLVRESATGLPPGQSAAMGAALPCPIDPHSQAWECRWRCAKCDFLGPQLPKRRREGLTFRRWRVLFGGGPRPSPHPGPAHVRRRVTEEWPRFRFSDRPGIEARRRRRIAADEAGDGVPQPGSMDNGQAPGQPRRPNARGHCAPCSRPNAVGAQTAGRPSTAGARNGDTVCSGHTLGSALSSPFLHLRPARTVWAAPQGGCVGA